jgi:hypothetical protein
MTRIFSHALSKSGGWRHRTPKRFARNQCLEFLFSRVAGALWTAAAKPPLLIYLQMAQMERSPYTAARRRRASRRDAGVPILVKRYPSQFRQLHMRPITVICFVLAFGVANALADTHVTLTGVTEGAEVCRFQARDRERPFDRWLTAKEATCVAASEALTFPKGLWNVFARSHGAVSIDPILIDSVKPPETLPIALVPAATVVLQLPAEHSGVLYSPKHVTAFPAGERTTVPAGEELWLLVLSKGDPVAVIPIAAINPGSERIVDARNINNAPALLGWLQLSDEDVNAIRNSRGVQVPHIHITAEGKNSEALPLPSPYALSGAFVFIPSKSVDNADLWVDGRGWIRSGRSIKVAPQFLTSLRAPIVVRATTTVIVNWSAYSDLPALDRAIGSCDASKDVPRFDLSISLCPEPKPGKTLDTATCTPVKTEALRPEMKFGTVTAEEVRPGTYRAELRYGKLPPFAVTSPVPPLQERPIQLQASYAEIYGSLTRGGAALPDDARVEIPGDGIGFSLRGSGEYHAVLMDSGSSILLGVDAKIDIVTCSGQRSFVLTDREVRRNTRFDIDIPDNILTVAVSDTFTRTNLPTASLKYTIMSLRKPPRPVMTRDADQVTGGGRFVIKELPERELRLTVTCPGYKKKEIEPFTMSKSEKKDLEVQLEPLGGSEAMIISSRPFENAMIFWYSVDGAETERVDLAPDGTFHFEQTHYRDETMTVVSLSHPLWILRAPAVERATPLKVKFPDTATQRSAEVYVNGVPARLTTNIGVAIGGLRVPQPVLAQHLALRGIASVASGSVALIIPALAETGPIDILLGPSTMPRGPRGIEMPPLRSWSPIKSQRLPPESPIVAFP